MKFKKLFNILWIVLFIIFVCVAIYMEIIREDNVRQLSSNELTPQVIKRIRTISWLFTYLIFYLIFLGAYSFVSVFRLLISPNVGGNIFKVITIFILYLACIGLSFTGYNNILNVNYFAELTGALSEPSIKTSYTHILMLIFINLAEYLKKSIRKENYKKHKSFVTKTELYHRHMELRDIIEKKSEN